MDDASLMSGVYCQHDELVGECLRCESGGDIVVEMELAMAKAMRGPWQVDYDSCDCGDGYGCSHGSWPHAFIFPEPWSRPLADLVVSDYHYTYTEISEIPPGTAEFMARSRIYVERLIGEIKRLRGS